MNRLLLAAALAGTVSGISLSAAPKSGDPASIILNVPAQSGAVSTPWAPKLGDTVTFTVSYPKTLDHYGVRIQVLCYQDGALVYGEAGPYNQGFLLGGAMSTWYLNDGAADCHADLYYWSTNGGQKFNQLATVAFSALSRAGF
jgi:hypothetical protein